MIYTDQQENLRVIGDYKLVRTDPYGFWYIKFTKGTTPKVLEDEAFTNTKMAIAALDNYLKQEKKATKPKEK